MTRGNGAELSSKFLAHDFRRRSTVLVWLGVALAGANEIGKGIVCCQKELNDRFIGVIT